jgi:hypothetical protein
MHSESLPAILLRRLRQRPLKNVETTGRRGSASYGALNDLYAGCPVSHKIAEDGSIRPENGESVDRIALYQSSLPIDCANTIGSRAPFDELQGWQSICKFRRWFVPPLASAVMWSICRLVRVKTVGQ